MSPLGEMFAAIFCVSAGLIIMGVSVDIIHVDPKTVHAPRWVVGSVGLAFFLAGLALFTSRYKEAKKFQVFLGATVLILLAGMANWIAFGPGERQFSGTISLPFSAYSSKASELSGRIAFGIFAGILDVVILGFLISGLRGRHNGRKS
ncbi:MAG: hypothetical protein ACREQA_08890 [Candidatus Binatia bacterium]